MASSEVDPSAVPVPPQIILKKKRSRKSRELKRMLFARAYVANGGNGTKAAMALPAPRSGKLGAKSAGTIANRLLNEAETIALVHHWAIKAKMEPAHALGAIGAGLEATSLVQGTEGKEDREFPDWNARLKAADLATRLLRLQPSRGNRSDLAAGRAQVHLHLPAEQGAEVLSDLSERSRIRHARKVNRPIDIQAKAVQEPDTPESTSKPEKQGKV